MLAVAARVALIEPGAAEPRARPLAVAAEAAGSFRLLNDTIQFYRQYVCSGGR